MTSVSIINVLVTNFRSFNDATVAFTPNYGMKFLGGENACEPKLGANGAGKTSLWEAIVWCLYGTSIRGAKTSSVLRWGEKQVSVIVTLKIGSETHIIKRSGPPGKVELNSAVVEQPAIDALLKLTRLRFLHSVIFGQGQPLFPDLSVPERGLLLDEVLDLSVWSRCLQAAADSYKQLEGHATQLGTDLSFFDGQLSALPTDEQLEAAVKQWELRSIQSLSDLYFKSKAWQKKFTEDLAVMDIQITMWAAERDKEVAELRKDQQDRETCLTLEAETLLKELDEVKLVMEDKAKELSTIALVVEGSLLEAEMVKKRLFKDDLEAKLLQLGTQRGRIQGQIDHLQEHKTFWSKNQRCPTCKQALTKAEEIEQLRKADEEITKLRETALVKQTAETTYRNESNVLSGEICALGDKISEQRRNKVLVNEQLNSASAEYLRVKDDAEKAVRRLENNTTDFAERIAALISNDNPFIKARDHVKSQSNPYTALIEGYEKEVNPKIADRDKVAEQRTDIEEQKLQVSTQLAKVNSELMGAEYWKHGFKRIRLYFVQKVLSALEIEIASAVSALGLEKWEVKLVTEAENKSGTTKLGVQIFITSPTAQSTWDSRSGGETQRLRLAIAMGLSALIQRAAGVWYDFEVWDEPSAWLSSEGIEDLLSALSFRADVNKKAVWVVDHRALTFSGFREMWMVTKEPTGSQVYMIAEASS